MKTLHNILVAGITLVGSLAAPAAISFTTSDSINYTASASGLSQVIPDNTKAGVGYLLDFGANGLSLSSVTVTFSLSGGYNGDLYAYLSHGSTLITLLNPNPAVSSSGFNGVTLSDAASGYIPAGNNGGVALSGSYQPFGNLSGFTGDPSGNWTLFFADLSGGDTSTLNGFNVNITTTAVPEPVNVALGVFGSLLVMIIGVRSYRSLRKAKAAALSKTA